MAKTKVKVLDAVVDGKTKGAIIEVEQKTAAYLIKNNLAAAVKSEAPAAASQKQDAKDNKDNKDNKDKK